MKKKIAMCMATLLMLSAVGCSGGGNAATTTTNTTTTTSTTSESVESTDSTDTSEEAQDKTPAAFEYYVWDIGAEGDDNPERALLEIYQEENPHIDLTVTTSPEGGDYNTIISSRAAAGDMPDVFMWHNKMELISRGWGADLTEFTSQDPDFANVVKPLVDGGSYNGRVYMLPKKMNFMGMFINKDIYEANNIKPLEFGYSMDDLLTAIEKTTTATTKGTSNYFPVDNFYPMIARPDKYWFATFDGDQVNFSAPEYAEGIAIYQKVTDNNWNLRNTTTEEFFGVGGWEFGEIGGIGSQFEGTWFFEREETFARDYVGLPNGVAGVLVNDYLSISAQSDSIEAAYDFAKYMSFGLEGIKTRLDLAEAKPVEYAFRGIPVIASAVQEVDDRFLEAYADYPGFIAAYKAANTAKLEGYKEIPGLSMAINDNDTGVQGVDSDGNAVSYRMWQLRDEIILGRQKLSDHAEKMTELGNQALKDAKAEIEAAFN